MKAAILLILLLPLQAIAQIHSAIEKYNADSLERLLPGLSGTALADAWNELAISYSYYNPSSCEKYADLALAMSEKLDYRKGAGDAERFLGLMYMYQGRHPEAVVHFYNALENYEDIEDDHNLARLYFDFARLQFYTGNYEKTEEYGIKAMDLITLEKPDGSTVGTLQEIARMKSALGLLYRMTGRSEMAKEIYLWYNRIMVEEGFEITDQLVHTQLIARCYYETGKPDSALWYFNKTLDFPEVNASIRALKMESVRSIGLVYFDMHDFTKAKKCFTEVAMVMDGRGFMEHAFKSNVMLGDIFLMESKPAQAENYYKKALALSDEIISRKSIYRYDSIKNVVSYGAELFFPDPRNVVMEDIWSYQARVTAKLYSFYSVRGDYRNALNSLILLDRAKDTLHTLQRHRDLVEMQTKYETARKEQQIDRLAEENRFKELKLGQWKIYMAGLGVIIIMLIVIGLLLIRQDKIRARQKMMVLEQKLLRSQMNPHFIFNSMASIQDLILSKDTKSASSYLSRFAHLIRSLLDASLYETIPVSKEIETIENYLQLQKVRLEEKFDFVILKDEDADFDLLRLPALLVQPFVENAIEHGIRHKQEKGVIKVEFRINDHWLTVSIEDNGVGRAKSREFEDLKKNGHVSVSTSLIRERMKLLNKKSKRKNTLDIIDLYDDNGCPSGTRVVIRLASFSDNR